MLKIVMGYKDVNRKNWIKHPEIKVGIKKIEQYLTKLAKSKKEYTVYSCNAILYDIGVLLYLNNYNVKLYCLNKNKIKEIILDDCGYSIKNDFEFYSTEIVEKVNNIRIEKFNE